MIVIIHAQTNDILKKEETQNNKFTHLDIYSIPEFIY